MNENGEIQPLAGVILMVAIIVVLASLISAIIFGYIPNEDVQSAHISNTNIYDGNVFIRPVCEDKMVCYSANNGGVYTLWCTRDADLVQKYCDGNKCKGCGS